jgi:ABC-2 type transport system permease protein
MKLYGKYLKMHLLSGLEYKGWWIMFLQVLITCVLEPMAIILMFGRFGDIGDWTMERILLIYSIALTSFGLAETFCRGFDYFPWQMLRLGNFDRLLLRPKSLFTQVSASFFHIHRIARALAGLFIIFWSLNRLGVELSAVNMTMLILALIGGTLMYSGVFVLSSGIAFFTINALDWIYIFTNASYESTRIPVDYMPRLLRYMFTFFMPMLVISYFPASAIGGWDSGSWQNYWTGWLALPAGAVFLCVSMIIWRIGVRNYKSTGS